MAWRRSHPAASPVPRQGHEGRFAAFSRDPVEAVRPPPAGLQKEGAMWRCTAVLCTLSVAFVGGQAETAPQVLLGFVDSDSRFAVQGAVKGAAARLARPGCQDVLSDLADISGHPLGTTLLASGRSPAEAFAALRFVDSHGE